MLAFGVASAMLLAVLKLASEVSQGDTEAFDRFILRGLRDWASSATPMAHAVRLGMVDLTALGDTLTLTLVVLLVTGFLLTVRKAGLALYVFAATTLGTLAVDLLKAAFDRPRPTVVPYWTTFSHTSFPSGHAADSAIVYLTLAAVVARSVESAAVRLYVLAVAALLALLVGISRVYLGVHWPTDVAAGWAVGAAWALVTSTVAWWLQARRAIEPPTNEATPVDASATTPD